MRLLISRVGFMVASVEGAIFGVGLGWVGLREQATSSVEIELVTCK